MLSFQIFLEKSWVFFGKDPDPGFYFSSDPDPDPYKKIPAPKHCLSQLPIKIESKLRSS